MEKETLIRIIEDTVIDAIVDIGRRNEQRVLRILDGDDTAVLSSIDGMHKDLTEACLAKKPPRKLESLVYTIMGHQVFLQYIEFVAPGRESIGRRAIALR